MSAIRHNTERRNARSKLTHPYGARSGKRRGSGDGGNEQAKGWGITDFLFGFFKRSTPHYDVEEHGQDDSEREDASRSMDTIPTSDAEPSVVDLSPPQSQSKHTEPPRTPSVPSDDDDTPAHKLHQVSNFLAENSGRPLKRIEVAGLVALLNDSVQDEPEPPFRFSPSPFTPARGTSPVNAFMGSSASAPAMTTSSSSNPPPAKSLARNPNGVYRWQGGGSARPRTRYQSPGFGTSRSMPIKMKLAPPEMSTTDKKRRKIGQDAESATSQRVSSATNAPVSSQGAAASSHDVEGASGGVASVQNRPNGVAAPSTPRIRTNNLTVKPTAPSVPSPLRQAWNQNDSPSPPHPPPVSKPTRAANIMSELIKEASPAPKPDFSNPYETSGPVAPKAATRRPVTKRPRAVAGSHSESKEQVKQEEKIEKKVSELSPQKIIEATVPKGSKRSRPPPGLSSSVPKTDVSEPAALRRSSRLKSPEPRPINGINGIGSSPVLDVVEEDESPTKKPKKAPSSASILEGQKSSIAIEEIEDVDMSAPSPSSVTRPAQIVEPEEKPTSRQRSQSPTASTSPTSPIKHHYGMKSSAPKAPSKLRYSIQAEGDSDKGEGEKEKAASTSVYLFGVSSASQPSPPLRTLRTEAEVKASVLAFATNDLPSFSFSVPTSSPGAGPGPSSQKSRDAAKAAAISVLPAFDFSLSAINSTPKTTTSSTKPVNGFDFAAAGMKQPTTSGDEWECSGCMLKNPASATEKCSVCDEPRPGKTAAPPAAGGFNWAGAGMKPPPAASGEEWECSCCMLKNPASVVEKCTVCDAPRPGKTSSPSVTGFNWAAAGMKAPAAPAGGSWTCSSCMLTNPASATDKCTVCDAPRPN